MVISLLIFFISNFGWNCWKLNKWKNELSGNPTTFYYISKIFYAGIFWYTTVAKSSLLSFVIIRYSFQTPYFIRYLRIFISLIILHRLSLFQVLLQMIEIGLSWMAKKCAFSVDHCTISESIQFIGEIDWGNTEQLGWMLLMC